MTNETAIKLVRDACSKQPEDGKFVLYEKDIEMIAQGFKYIVRAEALEEAAKVCRTAQAQGLQSIREAIEEAIRGLK